MNARETDVLKEATKDQMVLAMLAVLGGEHTGINERDLFLACWHAFPNSMRWVDTALPNPDTFTASLRRLDQRGQISRVGKQKRQKRRSSTQRKGILDPGRSSVVKAQVTEGGLEDAQIDALLLEQVRRLMPDPEQSRTLSTGALVAICVGLREAEDRGIDEGALVELAFHRFPSRFAYEKRSEFPDVGRIREGIRTARNEGLIDQKFQLTSAGKRQYASWHSIAPMRLDQSEGHRSGDLKFAARIEGMPGFQSWVRNGTLIGTKPDELYRTLRIPPTADPNPVADALRKRMRALQRVDKGEIAQYLMSLAKHHNLEVALLVEAAASTPDIDAG